MLLMVMKFRCAQAGCGGGGGGCPFSTSGAPHVEDMRKFREMHTKCL
jgi:hypothetical protein